MGRMIMIKSKGFTLIELMIVIAIVGILAGVAYPSYQASMQKSRRADAQADLMELSSFMERFFTVNNRYDQDTSGTAVALPFTASPRTGTAYYTLSLSAVSASAYTLRAVPTGSQTTDSCGTLTLTQTGQKTPATCW